METRCAYKLVLHVLLVVLAILIQPCAHATEDSQRLRALEEKLDKALQTIHDLTQRVHDLEAALAARSAAAPAPAPDQAAQAQTAAGAQSEQRAKALEEEVHQLETAAARPAEDNGVPLHAFADVGLGNHHAQYPQYKGFDIAELDFFLSPRLGERTRALFELNFEVGEDGSVGVDLERAQIGYQLANSATVWFGRFHTPFGYYNTAFHHGAEIATALRRPRFLEFEDKGGILPIHTVGAWLTGGERLAGGKLTYDLYIGNSQRITDGQIDMNNPGNTTGNAIFGGNVGFLPGGFLDGLTAGVHAFSTRIENQDAVPARFNRVTAYGAYAVYDTDRWEDLAEFYAFDNKDLSANSSHHRSEAGFVQFGYRAGRLTPYARYERAALQQSDDYFAAQAFGGSYTRTALGLRFDIDAKSAVKLELAATRLTDRIRSYFNDALIQYAIRF